MKNPLASTLNIAARHCFIAFRNVDTGDLHCLLKYMPAGDRTCETVYRLHGLPSGAYSADHRLTNDQVLQRFMSHPIMSHNKRGPRRTSLDGLTMEVHAPGNGETITPIEKENRRQQAQRRKEAGQL